MEAPKDWQRLVVAGVVGAGVGVVVYRALAKDGANQHRDALGNALKKRSKLPKPPGRTGPVRIWADGCFDMMHFGHANAFRQARALGDHLTVGVNPDDEVEHYKGGPPIMCNEERYAAVRACKWVDDVVEGVPYQLDAKLLEEIMDKYDIDYIVHGDDACLDREGNDVYAAAKAAGRFVTIKRTEGVSTTELVGRMLMMDKAHLERDTRSRRGSLDSDIESDGVLSPLGKLNIPAAGIGGGNAIKSSSFLPTTHRYHEFSSGKKPRKGDKIVYVDGAFDLFHQGHIELLKRAREVGDFLLVGVHTDDVVNTARGGNFPIMNVHERTLSVLSCRYVDEVIIGAPWQLTKDMLISMNISHVVHGRTSDRNPGLAADGYSVPKEMGIYTEVDSQCTLTTHDVVLRVLKSREAYAAKFEKKSKSEEAYYQNKEYVEEQ